MERENEDLIYDVENTIKLYEKCNCRIANVTRDMLDRLGYQKALAKWLFLQIFKRDLSV